MKKIFFALAMIVLATGSESFAAVKVGEMAPNFNLKDEQGNEHSLSQYRGKIVVLEWINPECPFVKRHYKAKTMTTLAETYSNKNVVWLAIDSSRSVTPEQSRKWIEKHKIEYPILQDPKGEVGELYEAKTTPHMFIVDVKGILRYQGAIDNDSWGTKEAKKVDNHVDQALKALFAGQPPILAETKPYGCSVKYKK